MRTTVVVIGAGHSGLAMSRRLTERSIDHVVLERGEVANSWRTERWDSLRLLTPNWHDHLPGKAYGGERAGRLHDGRRAGDLHRRLRGHDRRRPVHTSTNVSGGRRAHPEGTR